MNIKNIVSPSFTKVMIGSISVAGIFVLIEQLSWNTDSIFLIILLLLCGFFFGAVNKKNSGIIVSIIDGFICSIGILFFVYKISTAVGEVSHYGYLLLSPISLIFLPILGVYFNLFSSLSDIRIDDKNISYKNFRNRIFKGLKAGFIVAICIFILVLLKMKILVVFLEGFIFGGLLVWQNTQN